MNAKPLYRTYAYFYKYESEYSCRKYLDIRRDGVEKEHPELILLMTNPGDCENEADIWEQEIEIEPDAMVLKVQEFMRLHRLGWVRVLSLSDKQGTWDETFFKSFTGAGDNTFPPHSIFNPDRADELAAYAGSDTPFLVAGSHDPKTRVIANAAVVHMREKGLKIVNRGNGGRKRPSKNPNAWIEEADEEYRLFVGEEGHLQSKEDQAPQDKQGKRTAAVKIRKAFQAFLSPEPVHLIISSAMAPGRLDLFASLLRKNKLIHYTGTSDYDYIYTEQLGQAKALRALLRQHNGKRIIINGTVDQGLWTSRGVTALLTEATAPQPSNTGPVPKATAAQESGDQPFRFNGKIALLVNATEDELKNDKGFRQLLRNCLLV